MGFVVEAFSGKHALPIILCCSALAMPLYGQVGPAAKEGQEFDIKVGVEEVRIDAVVLDNKGRQVTDLTAADFELSQDGKTQKIISCTYVNEYRQTPPGGSPAKAAQSTSAWSRDEAGRTIVFVVDDIKLCFEHHYNTRMALQKFVETQMQPGDRIAIAQTDAGIGALQQFTSDKEKLFSRIRSLPVPYSPCIGRDPVVDRFEITLKYAEQSLQGAGGGPSMSGSGGLGTFRPVEDIFIKNKKPLGYLKELFDAKTAALDYAIKALQDMPGRKSLVFMTDDISSVGPDYLYDEMADQAMRAGIVIDTLDMTGVETGGPGLPASARYLPLSQKTGGILVENSNFFIHGINPVDEASKGYYLLSYIPPANTFNKNFRDVYHRVRVKVKRSGSEVHSRDGYLGVSTPSSPVARATTLQQAILSPFIYNNLELRVSSGYAYAPKPGYFLRSWLHLAGEKLAFIDEKNGGHSLSLEMLTLVADARSLIQDSKMLQYKFLLTDADVSRIRNEGIDLNTYLPVKNPGKYYVRAAVRDMETGKIGSGYQFLNIQDLKNRRLSLSSLFLLNPGEDASALKSGNIAIDSDSSDFALKWEASRKSPARRSYLVGEGFDYMAIVYNAKAGLELQFTVYKEGKEFYKGNPEDIDLKAMDDLGRISIMKRLDFNAQMEEGAYQLQLKVVDKQSKEKSSAAVQTIDFEIHK
jgi:VWFA-related protein